MNIHLNSIRKYLESANLDEKDKLAMLKSITDAEKQWAIVDFKLDRTEKVKKTTAILLEETIQELEQKRKAVEESHAALQASLEELKAAQQQLIQAEKMASLGELTAGIAHEIQNPLNFVNNFSEVSRELIDELINQRAELSIEDQESILKDIDGNLEKIGFHGKRADGIVKGMLQHSRSGSGKKEVTKLNDLADEYLRLAYHGIRAREKSFNATMTTEFDPNLGEVEVIRQDIGRVILNLITNAFYAVNEKASTYKSNTGDEYKPTVTVKTRREKDSVKIIVGDNGNGISAEIREKIFQPFFTTKPTGQGTGLGLSMSYDIVTKAHGGNIAVQSIPGKETVFTITIPL